MGKWMAIMLLPAVLLAACTTSDDDLRVHPRAVRSRSGCPQEVVKPGDGCYYLDGFTVSETIEWYQGKMADRGWQGPAGPPDDEPFPFYFTKNGRQVVLVFARYGDGTSLWVRLHPEP